MYKVAIVDDHKIYRDGFKLLVDSINSVDSVEEATNGKEFLELIKKKKIDVVFMDVKMPVLNGIEATQKALKMQPDLSIIALSSYENTEYINKMLFAGVEGYILKDADYEEIEEAINQVSSGHNYFSKKILVTLTRNTLKKQQDFEKKKNMPKITRREKEVLDLVSKGMSKTEIADKLFISVRTVEKHKENLMSKTGTRSTVNLIIFAIKNAIVEL
jgi:DNA-binding NarL/FixJ family response regulator